MSRLPSIASPEAISTLDIEAIITRMVASLVTAFAAAGVTYDVGNLEVDPAKIQAEVTAYEETLLRASINDAIKSNLLAFATGGDLENLGAFYGVTRLTDEDDDRYATRILLEIAGRSAAGPKAMYEAIAMAVSTDIKQARCSLIGETPELQVAILTSSGDGTPDQTLLDSVTAAVSDENVRVFSDVISASSGSQQTVDIEANVWLLPDAPQSTIDGLETALKDAWSSYSVFGTDLTLSWIISKLHVDGVSEVNLVSPVASVSVSDNNFVNIGTVTINFMGRLF